MHNSAINHEIVSGYLLRSMQRESRVDALAEPTGRIADCPLVFPSGSLIGIGIIRIIKHPTPGCNRRPAPTPRCGVPIVRATYTFFADPLRAAFHQLLNIIFLIRPQCRCYPLFCRSLFYQCECKITRQLRDRKLSEIGNRFKSTAIKNSYKSNGTFVLIARKFISWRTT